MPKYVIERDMPGVGSLSKEQAAGGVADVVQRAEQHWARRSNGSRAT